MRWVVFGATGYLGTRLLPELLQGGHGVRVFARTPAQPEAAPWRSRVQMSEDGIGLRHSPRAPHHLNNAEALDCWRVEHIDRPQLVRLWAELPLPGRLWLEVSVHGGPNGSGAVYRQRALLSTTRLGRGRRSGAHRRLFAGPSSAGLHATLPPL